MTTYSCSLTQEYKGYYIQSSIIDNVEIVYITTPCYTEVKAKSIHSAKCLITGMIKRDNSLKQ